MTQKKNETPKKKAQEKNKQLKTSKFTKDLKCVLTDPEKNERREQVLKFMDEAEAIEGRRKVSDASFKGEIAQLNQKANELRDSVRSGTEVRSVECQEEKDFAAGKVYHRRLDTNVIFHERPLTSDERQQALDLSKKAKSKNEVKAEASEVAASAIANATTPVTVDDKKPEGKTATESTDKTDNKIVKPTTEAKERPGKKEEKK